MVQNILLGRIAFKWIFNLKCPFIVQVSLKEISSFSGQSARFFYVLYKVKMNLASLFIVNLISMSNLTHFLDRLITDGKYKTILLVHDDASVRDNNFVPQLAELAFGKYATVNVNTDRMTSEQFLPYRALFGILQVIMLKFDENGAKRLNKLMRGPNFQLSSQNVVMLIPMPSNEQKQEIWKILGKEGPYCCRYRNMSVIFYETEMMANASRKSLEVFVFNHKTIVDLDVQEIDVENSVEYNMNNQSNDADQSDLNGKIFGSIIRKPNVCMIIPTTVNGSITKPVHRGNNILINLGSADYYLSNFIVRNLRAKDVEMQQIMQFTPSVDKKFLKKRQFRNCFASDEKIYGELYNKSPKKLEYIQRLCIYSAC